MHELDEAEGKLSDLRSRIQGTKDKLLYTGSLKSGLADEVGVKPTLQVFRKNGDTWGRYDAEFEMELRPGDVVEVTMPRN